MYEALHKKLGLEDIRLAGIKNMFEAIYPPGRDPLPARRYNPLKDPLPGYDPLVATLEDARDRVLHVSHDKDAEFAFAVFQKTQERLWYTHEHAHNLMVFDYTYDYDDYPRLLDELEEQNDEFLELAAEMQEIYLRYESKWEELIARGILSPDEHEIVVSNYHDTLEQHGKARAGDFADCLEQETIEYLKGRFDTLGRSVLNARADVVTLYVDRAAYLLDQIRYVHKCSDDGVLEGSRSDFTGYLQDSRVWMEDLLPQMSAEIATLRRAISSPKPAPERKQIAGFFPPAP